MRRLHPRAMYVAQQARRYTLVHGPVYPRGYTKWCSTRGVRLQQRTSFFDRAMKHVNVHLQALHGISVGRRRI
jgi:hypothetical protein